MSRKALPWSTCEFSSLCPASSPKSATYRTSLAFPEQNSSQHGRETHPMTPTRGKEAHGEEEQIRLCWQNSMVKVNTCFIFWVFLGPLRPAPLGPLQCPLKFLQHLELGESFQISILMACDPLVFNLHPQTLHPSNIYS